jgi:hypothetical protein
MMITFLVTWIRGGGCVHITEQYSCWWELYYYTNKKRYVSCIGLVLFQAGNAHGLYLDSSLSSPVPSECTWYEVLSQSIR